MRTTPIYKPLILETWVETRSIVEMLLNNGYEVCIERYEDFSGIKYQISYRSQEGENDCNA